MPSQIGGMLLLSSSEMVVIHGVPIIFVNHGTCRTSSQPSPTCRSVGYASIVSYILIDKSQVDNNKDILI